MLITLEGIESCGKTTQAIVLECYLNMLGLDTIRTRMPGGCEISDQIRGILLDTENDNMATETEMLLFGAAYAQLMSEVIIPALQQDKVVICDRFFDSMFSYQLFGRRSPKKHIKMIYESAFQGIYPEITFLLDIPVEVSMDRVVARGDLDRIEVEGEDFYKRIYEGYQSIHLWDAYHKERVVRIDATQPKSKVWREIAEKVDSLLFPTSIVPPDDADMKKDFHRLYMRDRIKP